MREFYWRTSTNFGDALNHWLWEQIFPELMGIDDQIRLIGVGSLIKADLERVQGLKLIFGSGAGYGSMPDLSSPREWRVYFVRGPLTARAAGLPVDRAIVDASWLIGHVDEFRHVPPKQGTIFIPHYSNAILANWKDVCEEAGVSYVDPLGDSKSVISRISRSELVITESLHGAIIADYFRTPWIPVRLSDKFLDFKWLDWCRSVEVEPSIHALPPTDLLDHIRQRKRFPTDLESAESKLRETQLPAATRPNTRKATQMYALKQRVRTTAHRIRESALHRISAYRNFPFITAVNRRRNHELAGVLINLARKRPNLSLDTVRQEKLERLANAVEDLKRDYEAGILARPQS